MGGRELEYTKYGVDMGGGPPFSGSASSKLPWEYLDLLLYCCDAYLDASGRPCLEQFKLYLEEGGRDEDGGIPWRLIVDGGGWRYVDGGGA
jgi:hypothetical protein